jgi:ribosome assembly protein 1
MDSREDEQKRMITMKSSAISLIYEDKEVIPSNQDDNKYLVNLIDSPGHVEFSSEVWTGLKVTDGAFILIDVLEGVSSQTYTVLKQAFDQEVKMVLILNKVDRLIHELKMTPNDIYK